MTKKIFVSIFSVALVVLLASLAIATTFLYNHFHASQVKQLKAELALVADITNDVGVEYFENFDSTVFRFTVIDKDGKVLYDTEATAQDMENHAEREEIKEAFESGSGSSARNSETLTQKNFYEAVLLDSGHVLRISVSQMTMGALLLEMLPIIVVIVLVAALFTFLLSHRMARKITEPLLELDLEHPTDKHSYEELTPILLKIQNQNRQITAQIETLRRKAEEFEQITSSMSEGLVLLDENGMILSMNTAAKKIFAVKSEIRGIDFFAVERSSKMGKAVVRALEGEHGEFTEERNGLEYQFNISPIASDNKNLGAVILTFDITDRAFAERNRQEFTANVTHELKTPLQSIIGSAELLENGLVKPEDTGRFVGNIRKEASRLVSLINDIIRLSQLDENHEPATETVDLMDVAKEVVEVLGASASKRNITLNIEGDSQTIFGVRRYIYEIIYNLCDNAIRYNTDGGSVTISIKKEDGRVKLSVSDTGIGIPPEHQARIFERFYRVDKSHSKETGGTGLGLSIVKHAVQYHGGKVSIDSEVNTGTTVHIVF